MIARSRRLGLLATAVIGLVAMAGTTVSAAPPPSANAARDTVAVNATAGDTAAVNAVAAAAPCGLSGTMKSHPLPGWNWYNYQIRNCHSYAVWRLVDVTNSVTRDGYCHFIRAGGTVSGRIEMYTQFDTVLGLKEC